MEKRVSELKVNTLIDGLEKKMKEYVLQIDDTQMTNSNEKFLSMNEQIKQIKNKLDYKVRDLEHGLEKTQAEVNICSKIKKVDELETEMKVIKS